MKRIIPLMLLFAMAFLAACNPFAAAEIREQAKADQIAAQTLQETLNQEQSRKHAEDMHRFELQEAERRQARKGALEPAWIFVWTVMIYGAGSALAGMAILTVVSGGRTFIVQLNRIQEGFATAMITAADVRSRLIYLDPNTRQFPLLYQYNGKGRYLVTDPNTKVTIELDTRNEGDAQMIAGAIAIRHSGIVEMEQRRSGAKDAASMAVVQPPIIEGTALDIKTIARDLVKQESEYE